MCKSPIYGPLQSAYRAFHSTETAMIRVVNDLLVNVDSGSPSLLLSLDVSAAFDTLNHERLLQRAEDLFGFTDNTNLWLASYLTDRSSFVSMGTCKSNTVFHTTGVPQGSVLGPLLFSIFTSPIGSLISSFCIVHHQYADDTQLYTSLNTSTGHSILELSACANAVTRWHLENGLLLNPSKSEALITGSKHQVKSFDSSAGLKVAGSVVPFVDNIKLLGVTIDKNLSFDNHISDVVRSCNYHIRSLRHIRHLIDRDTAVTLACSIVASRLDYCNSLLYGVTDANIVKLQRVQNSLARTVCDLPYGASTTGLLRELHWLPIKQRITYKIASITYRTCHSSQPVYLRDLLINYQPARTLRSSNSHLLVVPNRVKTVTSSRAFSVAAPTIWNHLPDTCKTADSFNVFKRRLKCHLFDAAFVN